MIYASNAFLIAAGKIPNMMFQFSEHKDERQFLCLKNTTDKIVLYFLEFM